MKVLIACEYSGRVRDAFIKAGHDAMSCDLLPTDEPGPHYQGDVAEYMIGRVCHPMDRLGIDWVARNIAETIEENICCWCDDETGAEEPSIELSADDKIELGKMVAEFVRAKASVNWWTTDDESETTHTYVAGSNE